MMRRTLFAASMMILLATTTGLAAANNERRPAKAKLGQSSNPLIRNRYDGFYRGNASSTLVVELFGDFQCPDTLNSWNAVWKPLASRFANEAVFYYHDFPLPYHRSAHDAGISAVIAAGLASADGKGKSRNDAYWEFADVLFANQAQFSSSQTLTKTPQQVRTEVFAALAEGYGLDRAAFLSGFSNSQNDRGVRLGWKWGAAKGVYATPTFAINGALVFEADAWSLQDWEQEIVYLLSQPFFAAANPNPNATVNADSDL
eukprot:TRINITY_DN6119_c0_g1_i2.p2 TRINITY_DN6119_c0_g1~~TRINITY_DN6119_c0_g1_i2.p2  ORF type:complete len:259 (+),score=56.06 TRINITY_DN6119_c0_g1_i2:52-828(+)